MEITLVTAANVDGAPVFLASQGGGNPYTYLGNKDPNGNWKFEEATPRSYAKLSVWQGNPAIVGSTSSHDPHELFFDYPDGVGGWRSENIVSDNQLRSMDFAVVNGQPIVAYFDTEGSDRGMRVAMRLENGVWTNQLLGPGNNSWLNGIDIFEVNGRPAIAFVDGNSHSLKLVQVIPEPECLALSLVWLTIAIIVRKRYE